MAQCDSARQEESIGITLVLNGGVLTPKPKGFVRGAVGRPLKEVSGDLGHGGWHLVSKHPPP